MTNTQIKSNLEKTKIESIAISCNTFLRPNILAKTLDSIAKLNIPDDILIKVLVVDNDKNATAKPVIEKIKATYPFELTYCVEEKRGLANARNRLLQEAINLGVSHIAILDDDDIADKDWVLNLVDLYNNQENAYIISGPEYCCFDGEFPKYLTNNNIFVKKTTKKKGELRKVCSTHNAFFPVNVVKDANIWFDSSFVFMGGEDGDFFYRASSRNYYNGYSGSYLQYKNKNKPIRRLLYLIKMILICFIDVVISLISIILGRTLFFNVLGLSCKNIGKLMGAILLKPMNYYEFLNGGISK